MCGHIFAGWVNVVIARRSCPILFPHSSLNCTHTETPLKLYRAVVEFLKQSGQIGMYVRVCVCFFRLFRN